MLGVVICLSLVVIVGFVGQISVVQLALAGVAGFTMSHLTTDVGGVWAKFPISLLIGAAVATIVGLLIVAVSALRVRGVSLAVVTLAAAVALEQFGFLNARWGGGDRGSPVEQPELGGLDLSPGAHFRGLDGNIPSPVFGFLVLAATILLGLLVANVRRGSLGQRMLAVRSNERAAAAAGINVRNTKLVGLRHRGIRRRDGRRALRVQLRFGQLQPLRRPRGARPDRIRLLRRHHHGLRRRSSPASGRRRVSSPTPSTSGSASRGTGRCSSAASR